MSKDNKERGGDGKELKSTTETVRDVATKTVLRTTVTEYLLDRVLEET